MNVGIHVPVGENGINTKEDAIRAIAEGATLAQIPDNFIYDALNGNGLDINDPMRDAAKDYLQSMIDDGLIDVPFDADVLLSYGYGQFVLAQTLASADLGLPDGIQVALGDLEAQGKLPKYVKVRGGSVASPTFFFELLKGADGEYKISGQGYILKAEDPYVDLANLKELIGVEVAQYMGAPQEAGRVDGKTQMQGQLIALPLANNFIDGKQLVGRYNPTEKNELRLHNLMMNFTLGILDRHEMNGLVYQDKNGNDVAVPIDFGRALEYSDDVDEDSLKFYAEELFEMDPNGGFSDVDIQEVNEMGKSYIENLKRINFDDMARRLEKMWAGKRVSEGDINETLNTMQERVQQLIALLENQGLGDILFS